MLWQKNTVQQCDIFCETNFLFLSSSCAVFAEQAVETVIRDHSTEKQESIQEVAEALIASNIMEALVKKELDEYTEKRTTAERDVSEISLVFW